MKGEGDLTTALLIILSICLLVDVFLVVFTVTRPDRRRMAYLTMLCFVLVIYTLGYMLELISTTSEAVFIALVVENFAIPQIAGLYLLSALSLFRPKRLNRVFFAVTLLWGLSFFTIVLFNPLHELYYEAIDLMYRGGGNFYLQLTRGPLFYVNQAFTIICSFTAYTIMIARYFRGSRKLRRQMKFFILGSLACLAANILNFTGILPQGLDPTPIALTLALAIFAGDLIWDDTIDVVVKARNTAVETMTDAFIVLDNEADFLYCNHSATLVFPALQELQESQSIYTLESWPAELAVLTLDQETTFSLGEADGLHNYRAMVQKIYGWGGKKPMGISVIIRDITAETKLIDQLEKLATTDFLTGILNRRQMVTMIERELALAERQKLLTALVLFDIDYFKRINDKYGHSAGDEVLRQMAATVQSSLRVYDIFGRFGGEEFVIFTHCLDEDTLVQWIDRIRRTIEELEIKYKDQTIRLTASFGVILIQPGGELNEALTKADAAMYQAKTDGRNRVVLGEGVVPDSSGAYVRE